MSYDRILIDQGRIIDPANNVDAVAPLYIAGGRVVALGRAPDGFEPDRVIDARDRLVCPGFVDLCARLRSPDVEDADAEFAEYRAAAAGGVTTMLCPPDGSLVIDSPAVVRLLREQAQNAGLGKVLPTGALTRGLNGQDLSEMGALQQAGCLAVGNGDAPVANALVWRRALEYAGFHGLLVIARPEDVSLKGDGCVHEGWVGSELGLPGIPACAETVALAQLLALVEQTGVRVHVNRLSTARAVDMLALAQAQGLPVSADIAIHHAHLTEAAVGNFDANAHAVPPFRTVDDRAGLIKGLSQGVICALCSDHHPLALDARQDAFQATLPGLASLQMLLPLALRLVEENEVTLSRAIALLTSGPAGVLGIEAGTLTPGVSADVCVIDSGREWTVNESFWLSCGRNTPYWNKAFKGLVTHTLISGRLASEL
ncbi:dihydroorotase [Candidatus Methylospira mobilis]|uniref:Dihydroorotase n=1 Tax=Candidatus Methylospira mobilis TaxID=1808979 RepID=A0A5Q0BES1_9GAMM|nr:dihydroorotase [Candidatus Methylospira mobilis]QFY42363.1 dihydroorotase [Candidatus Methylospira mobilis]